MKKTVRPMSWMMILFGIVAVICVVTSFAEFISTGSSSAAAIALDALAFIGFGIYLVRYLRQGKIEFDENNFTVGETTYRYDEITRASVDNEQILRSASTLMIKLFIGEDEIARFTKDDKGGKDFIAEMKKHGVSVSIDV